MSGEDQLLRDKSLKVALIISVSAVAFGVNCGIYNLPVANNLKPYLVDYINGTQPMAWVMSKNKSYLNAATLFGFVASAFTAGSAVGTFMSPTLAECLGRRFGLMVTAMLNILGSFICFFYLHLFELVFIGRLLIGISYGMGIPLASVFIVEVSPLYRRVIDRGCLWLVVDFFMGIILCILFKGQLNALLQTAYGVGNFLGMLVTVPDLLGSVHLSPYALSLPIILSIVLFVVMCFAHETPRFLILKRDRLQDAIKALKYYQDDSVCDQVVKEIQTEARNYPGNTNGCSLFVNFTKMPFYSACLLWGNCALIGIGLILTFSTDAFVDNGIPRSIAQWSTVAIGASNVLGSLLAIRLMDSWGRKPLLLTGLMGCFFSIAVYTLASWILRHQSTSVSTYAYFVVPCLISFILFFALYGAACATLSAELCPQFYRSAAISSGVFATMAISTVLISVYQLIKQYLGYPFAFLPSSVFSVVLGLYLWLAVPETKGRTLSELSEYSRKKSSDLDIIA